MEKGNRGCLPDKAKQPPVARIHLQLYEYGVMPISTRIPITRHVVVISGFRQEAGRATTGVDSVWWELHSRLSGPGTALWLRAWDDDHRVLAAQIDRYANNHHADIVVIAYSWGVGYGAIRLAHELRHYGRSIRTLYSIDGVYRHWTRIRSLFARWNPLAPRIVLPTNIESCIYWRQVSNHPQGHEIVPSLPIQAVIPGLLPDGVIEGHTHQTIDNSRVIHEAITTAIAEGWE